MNRIVKLQQLSGEVVFKPKSKEDNNQETLYQIFLKFSMVAVAFLLVAYSG